MQAVGVFAQYQSELRRLGWSSRNDETTRVDGSVHRLTPTFMFHVTDRQKRVTAVLEVAADGYEMMDSGPLHFIGPPSQKNDPSEAITDG